MTTRVSITVVEERRARKNNTPAIPEYKTGNKSVSGIFRVTGWLFVYERVKL
jgi:hypothetical protein